MQSTMSREAGIERRTRQACPRCGERVELSRMRAHLREHHQVNSAELERAFLVARRAAQKTGRSTTRF